MDLRETGYYDVDCMQLAGKRFKAYPLDSTGYALKRCYM
jgi:hypothetical protein